MSLPKQVQAHQRELDAYEAQLQAPNEEAPEETSQDEPEQPAEPTTTESVAPSEPAQPQAPKWDEEEEKWEHKYRRLQGKYDAEVPRLHNEVRELKQVIGSLQTKLDTPAPKQEERSSLITKDDVDAFGEDLIDLQRRVAQETAREFQTELGKLRSENEKLRERLDQTGSQIGEVSFNTQLRQLIPDFDQVNQDMRWVAWLDEFDPMVQGPRRALAQAAFARGDARAVKGYVDLWRSTVGAPAPQTAQRQQELRRQVQPERAHSQVSQERNGQKTYSEKEARSAFDRIQKLVIQGRYDEAAKLETEISAAYTEGRVQM